MGQEVVGARLEGAQEAGLVGVQAEHDDRHVGVTGSVAGEPRYGQAICSASSPALRSITALRSIGA